VTDISTLRLHAHFDEGTGPVIVMLHGINSDGGDWRTVIDSIGPGYRFVAFDLLGFGASPKPLDIDYSADEHALVIENTLQDLGVDDEFLLVGYSLGGDIALRYASTYPKRLRRLFLLDAPFYLPPSALEVSATGLKYAYEIASQRLWNLLATSKQKDSFIYRLATGAIQKPLEDAFHSDDIPTHWDIMSKNLENTVNKATWVDDLPKLTMPVVHAIGVRDAIVKVSQAPALKRLKPDLEIRRIPGLAADHMVLWNMPERVAQEIVRDEVRELNVVWRGGSGEPLVLLHSLQEPSERWLPAAEILARNNDVAVIDLLGFGDSPAPPALHYTLADHVAAVLGTVAALWGPNRSVRFAGDGFGATVALGCAATVPDRSAGVIAFSPVMIEPGVAIDEVAHDERSARVLVVRDLAHRIGEDRHITGRAAEIAEQRLVPIVRTLENGVLATDSVELLAQVPAPVRFVLAAGDTLTPRAFLSAASERRDGFEVLVVEGGRGLPAERPLEAVRAIDPADDEGIVLAQRLVPRPIVARRDPLGDAIGGVQSAVLRAGLLNLMAALLIVTLHPLNERVLTWGFAAWVAVASASAVVGALTMKRRTSGTRFTFTTTALPTLLAGLAGLVLAAVLFVDPAVGRGFFGVSVAVYAMVRGAADLFLAMRVQQSARPRWLLFASAAIGLATALSILFGPSHGRGILRMSLALYLGLTGASLIAYVFSMRRAARRRIVELLGR